jgi:hypothetical protein
MWTDVPQKKQFYHIRPYATISLHTFTVIIIGDWYNLLTWHCSQEGQNLTMLLSLLNAMLLSRIWRRKHSAEKYQQYLTVNLIFLYTCYIQISKRINSFSADFLTYETL